MANKSKLSHLTKDQKRQRGNVMAWRRDAINSIERDGHYLYQYAVKYLTDPSQAKHVVGTADSIMHNMNRLKLINKELQKYDAHN